MKKIFLFVIPVFCFFFSCHHNTNPQTPDKKNDEVPKALEEKSSNTSFLTKSRYNDIIDDLYQELLDNNADLKTLDQNIGSSKKYQTDSAETYNLFNEKNTSYYSLAKGRIGNMQDSAIKEKLQLLVENSLNNYNNKTAAHNGLMKTIESKDVRLSDLYTVLKLVKTLAVIESYQNNHLPSTASLKSIIKNYDQLIQKTDSAAKSNN